MNTVYYKIWNKYDHIKVFGKRINDEKSNLTDVNILFTEENKLQFYIDQIYDINMFDKEDITEWEKKKKSEKTWVNATTYFEELISDYWSA